MNPFHLAIPVHDIELARRFYKDLLNCKEGRSDRHWVDFDFYGHQLVCHLDESMQREPKAHNPVDGHEVPIPHFGIVLDMNDWKSLADKLKASNIEFVIEPCIRFKDRPGEQGTLFFYDPSGNAIEIKGFNNIESQLFAT
jgi:extradiol dioxygenase family protein